MGEKPVRSRVPTRSRTGRALAALAAAFALALTGASMPASATPPPPAPTLPAPNTNGITVTSWSPADPNNPTPMYDVTMTTAAIFVARGGTPTINPVTVPVNVRISLPANYQTNPANPYDVLYLLNGGTGDYQQWSKTNEGDVAAKVAASSFDGIVVMPEGGKSGWFSDWAGHTDGFFAPQWETFHIQQLVPWIDANFNTTGTRAGRAIAGVSMGGLGALKYAGRHPGLFSAVGAFSGGTTIYPSGAQDIVDQSMWGFGAAFSWNGLLDGKYRVTGTKQYRMETVFGPPSTWPAQNPVNLALNGAYANYDKFAMYSGGRPTGEVDINTVNEELHDDLDTVGVDHRYCSGPGDHSWGFWRNDLSDFLEYVYGTTPTSCTANTGWTAQ